MFDKNTGFFSLRAAVWRDSFFYLTTDRRRNPFRIPCVVLSPNVLPVDDVAPAQKRESEVLRGFSGGRNVGERNERSECSESLRRPTGRRNCTVLLGDEDRPPPHTQNRAAAYITLASNDLRDFAHVVVSISQTNVRASSNAI